MQRENQINQSEALRKSPVNGGPIRIMPNQQAMVQRSMPGGQQRIQDSGFRRTVKRAFLKKALPYLVAGGTTGAGVGWAWQMIF